VDQDLESAGDEPSRFTRILPDFQPVVLTADQERLVAVLIASLKGHYMRQLIWEGEINSLQLAGAKPLPRNWLEPVVVQVLVDLRKRERSSKQSKKHRIQESG
jgi:hypothetical protein